METNIWAIPGFLGLPTDWDFLQWNHLKGVDWQSFSWNSLGEWAIQFNQWAKPQAKKTNILMGYSLGGRLALHALIDQPQQWQAAIIISAHAGLADPQAQKKRIEHDQKWAEQFEKDEWKSLMQAWNNQKIFTHDHFDFKREESNYQRSHLVKALSHGSLGKQMCLYKQIASLPIPILWITGSKDQLYCQLAQTLVFAHPYSQCEQIEQAGHRVPWAQPVAFSTLAHSFIQKIEQTNS